MTKQHPITQAPNPCLSCGACCAYYRCSFHWSETSDATPGGVPLEYTVDLGPFRRAMRGSNSETPRCIALKGEVGRAAHCTVYERRSSTCRGFPASWAHGEPNERCDKARAAHGLEPLTREDWERSDTPPSRPDAPRPLRPAA